MKNYWIKTDIGPREFSFFSLIDGKLTVCFYNESDPAEKIYRLGEITDKNQSIDLKR